MYPQDYSNEVILRNADLVNTTNGSILIVFDDFALGFSSFLEVIVLQPYDFRDFKANWIFRYTIAMVVDSIRSGQVSFGRQFCFYLGMKFPFAFTLTEVALLAIGPLINS